jgi:hypothetical protein
MDILEECLSALATAAARISLASAPITDPMTALKNMGLDYSVNESSMRDWLASPDFTPYPAILGALNTILNGKRFREPIYMDVLVYIYRESVNFNDPHKASEVNPDKLMAAALKAHLDRYGTAIADFQAMLD